MKYNVYKKSKYKSFFLKNTYIILLLLLSFFIFIFWCFIYKNEGLVIANQKIILFFTSYLLEISLSIDNVVVWYLIFQTFKIPRIYQKRVLLYGFLGAIILRFIIVLFGKFLFSKFYWLLYLFAFFFLLTGLKFIFLKNKQNKKEKNISNVWMYHIFRVTKEMNNEKFFVMINEKIFVTPLFLALLMIEISDVVFSIDSIPAIFSITDNFLIIFTVNLFSVLGLRMMYFFIASIIEKFSIIQYGLSTILIFIGFKILIEKFFIFSTFISFLIILTIFFITFAINFFLECKKK